jgi:hypothetical protein
MDFINLVVKELKAGFTNPKFLHVLLSWGQAWGFLFGVLLLCLSKWVTKEAKSLKIALVILVISGAMSYGIEHNARAAKPDTMTAMVAGERAKHEDNRRSHAIFYYVFAIVCLMNLVGQFEANTQKWFFIVMAAGSIALMLLSFWHQLRESKLVYNGV